MPYRPEDKANINLVMKINSDACYVGGGRRTLGGLLHGDLTQAIGGGKAPRGAKDEEKFAHSRWRGRGTLGHLLFKW